MSLFTRKHPVGVDVNALLQRGAQKLLADRDEQRQKEASGALRAELDQPDTFCIVQRPCPPLQGDPLREPRVEWDPQGTMPWGVPHFTVRAAPSEAMLNKQSLDELLRRRFRRHYRALLIEQKVMPREQALERVMHCVINLVDVQFIVKPGEG